MPAFSAGGLLAAALRTRYVEVHITGSGVEQQHVPRRAGAVVGALLCFSYGHVAGAVGFPA